MTTRSFFVVLSGSATAAIAATTTSSADNTSLGYDIAMNMELGEAHVGVYAQQRMILHKNAKAIGDIILGAV